MKLLRRKPYWSLKKHIRRLQVESHCDSQLSAQLEVREWERTKMKWRKVVVENTALVYSK
ncbi:hypothetical protein T4B_5321 [Trichinella pseudospiralis]|uniref:Uncharacterized protein n=2 Tax=Trichinella pseudospiralis TaxID=6337 RepID=A0A0V1GPH5_TRIPS|nr:hypothetical protein T4D_16850 [Trichinella pseudospiralis]KRY80798.1 hypothetical protein T4D_7270 [Trichinella pseudospiralis]KRY99996.1 hypothetical protein T4B_930 [Trichinella pseudospiralis]KRZ00002.1 hypothetical protein T4B_7652 [Trichinella pseudospiralis]KRZ00010.1 hypothetical protein T4B_1396 [Trichinella pseudospiralis]